jgi:hypothetical protein
MSITMKIPTEWLTEAGLQHFSATTQSFLCTAQHVLIPLANIEKMVRILPLDANGFRRDKMMPVLVGIRDAADIKPPVPVERVGIDRYRLRDGTHRFYASLALGFSHLPCDICEPY